MRTLIPQVSSPSTESELVAGLKAIEISSAAMSPWEKALSTMGRTVLVVAGLKVSRVRSVGPRLIVILPTFEPYMFLNTTYPRIPSIPSNPSLLEATQIA
jgi:hypothetical protein